MSFYSSNMGSAGWAAVGGAVPGWHAYNRGSQVLLVQVVADPENPENLVILLTLNE
jgi:hypothetical protein